MPNVFSLLCLPRPLKRVRLWNYLLMIYNIGDHFSSISEKLPIKTLDILHYKHISSLFLSEFQFAYLQKIDLPVMFFK